MRCEKCGKNIPEQINYCPTCKVHEMKAIDEIKKDESLPETKMLLNTAGRLMVRIVFFAVLLFPCYFFGAFAANFIRDCSDDSFCEIGSAGLGLVFAPFLSLGITILVSKKNKNRNNSEDNRPIKRQLRD